MANYKELYNQMLEEIENDLLYMLNQEKFNDDENKPNYLPIREFLPYGKFDYFAYDCKGDVVPYADGYSYSLRSMDIEELCEVTDKLHEMYEKQGWI